MQPESQKISRTPLDFHIVRVSWRIVFELFFVLLTLYAFGSASFYLAPIYVDHSLLPPAYVDGSVAIYYNQSGWPLPCCATYWIDYYKGGQNSGYNTGSYNFVSLAIDILLFYIPLRLFAFITRRMYRRLARQYDSRGYIQHYEPYLKCIILCLVGLLIIAYAVTAYTEQPSLHIGVPGSGVPVQVGGG